jgi:Glycosyl transferase family 2
VAPKVSVAIPTYDAAAIIATAIASVAVQDFRELEVIVVDDAAAMIRSRWPAPRSTNTGRRIRSRKATATPVRRRRATAGSRRQPATMSARLRLLERIRLTPEGLPLRDMCRLGRALMAAGHRTFALSLHSPSLSPGGSPCVRTETELDEFFDKIERFLEFFYREFDGRPTDPIALKAIVVGRCRVPAATPLIPAAMTRRRLLHREQAGGCFVNPGRIVLDDPEHDEPGANYRQQEKEAFHP